MSPNLQNNIFDLIYWTFLHNSDAIALFLSVMFALGLLFWRPQRVLVLWLIGFTLLLARFEYLKHVVDPLTNQTLEVLIRTEGHYRARQVIDVFFYDVLPLGMYLIGWGSIWLGMWFSHGKKMVHKVTGEKPEK
jgi:hypothetical protein